MSKGTLFGFIAAVCVVLGSILSATDKPLAFVDVPSMIIVIGGTFVALFLSYETSRSRPFVLWAKPSAVTRIPKPR